MEACLFDLDGTLLDTAPDFVKVVNTLREQLDLAPLESAVIRAQVSDGARALVKLACADHGNITTLPNAEELEARRLRLLELYKTHVGLESRFFPGMEALLEKLEKRRVPWAIVTNKPRLYTDLLFERVPLAKRCAVSVCPDDVENSKPDPEGLLQASRKMLVNPANCTYIGDHLRDIEAGRRANMRTVAVQYGYIADAQVAHQWQADHVVATVDELSTLLFD